MIKLIILLTKLSIIKWKKRIFIESLLFDGDIKYKTEIFGVDFLIIKTSLIFPQSCYLGLYKNDKLLKRYDDSIFNRSVYDLYNILEKMETEHWIPQYVLDNKKLWKNDDKTKNIIREIKLKRIVK